MEPDWRSKDLATGGSARTAAVLLVAVALAGCGLLTPFAARPPDEADGGTDGAADGATDGAADGATDADGGEDADIETDAELLSGEGPLVLAVNVMAITERRECDVDGDGTLDNVIADLGEDTAQLYAVAVNTALARTAPMGDYAMLHFQWVDDRAVPSTSSTPLAVYIGRDTDLPENAADDDSGSEPFYAGAASLDSCGEPRFVQDGARLVDGSIEDAEGDFVVFIYGQVLEMVSARLSGTVAPHGQALDATFCGCVPVSQLWIPISIGEAVDRTLLEAFVAGGGVFGLEAIPGVDPDVDLDGDGLESFEADEDGLLLRCIDGDRTVIEGRDCWSDPRIQDCFSITVHFEGVGARYAGREPGWEYDVDNLCDALPDESFFDTVPATSTRCAVLEDPCDPRAPQPCCDPEHRCSGANRRAYRCYGPCDAVSCEFGPQLGSCWDVRGHGQPVCWPVDGYFLPDRCTPGETGCETSYGVTSGTVCFESSELVHCVERCTLAAGPCASPAGQSRCTPLPFEDGGVCAYAPSVDPLNPPPP